MSAEDMYEDIEELAKRFWEEDLVLSEALEEIRQKYSKEVRKEFIEQFPPGPSTVELFGKMLLRSPILQISNQKETE